MSETIDLLISNCDTSEELLSGIVEPLRSHFGKELRLVIVDDCSPIHDFENLQQHIRAEVLLCRHETRWGVTATMAHLLELGKSPFRFIGNSDLVIPSIDPLQQMAALLEQAPAPAMLGTAEGPRFMDDQAKPYTLIPTKGETFPWVQDYTSACAMMLGPRALSLRPHFDTAYSPGYYEDAHLSYSMRSSGCLTGYYRTTIAHLGNTAIIRDEMNHLKNPDRTPWADHKETNRLRFLETWAFYLRPRAQTYEEARTNWEKTQTLLTRKGTP